jgi:hypothetical protein
MREILSIDPCFIDEATGYHVPKMIYTNFAKRITIPHGVIVEGWPPSLVFKSPSDMGSKSDLLILHAAWQGGTASFKKLSAVERAAFVQQLEASIVAASTTTGAQSPAAEPPDGPTIPIASAIDASTPPAFPIEDSTSPSSIPPPAIASGPSLPGPGEAPPAQHQGTESSIVFGAYNPTLGADGGVIQGAWASAKPAKKRKERADKGKPRGPSKKRKTNQENEPCVL